MPCEENYIECTNKDLSVEELFKLIVTIDDNGNPALRNCGGGGGGVSVPLLVGQSLFVSSQGSLKPLSGSATRESLTNHYSDINEAFDDAVAGDTIFVFGGNHIATKSLVKNQVNWVFYGNPVISTNGGFSLWSDALYPSGCYLSIKGNAVFVNNFAGGGTRGTVISMRNSATQFDIECFAIIGNSSQIVFFENCRGTLTATESIEMYGDDMLIYCFGSVQTDVTVNSKRIITFTTSLTNFNSCIRVESGFAGKLTINCPLITKETNPYTVVRLENSANGELIINGNIIYAQETGGIRAQAVWCVNGRLTLNGNIDTVGYGFRTAGGTNQFKHLSGYIKSTSANNYPVVFFSTNNSYMLLKGEYISDGANERVIELGGTGSEYELNDVIIKQNNLNAAAPVLSGINIIQPAQNSNKIILNGVDILFLSSVILNGSSIQATALKDVIIRSKEVGSNIQPSANIINVIPATNFIYDTNY